jgi:hypothetical protein
LAYVETRVSVEHDGSTWSGEWTVYPPYVGQDGKVAPNRYLVVSQVVNDVPIAVGDLIGASRRQTMDATMLLAKTRMKDVQQSQLFPAGNEDMDAVSDVILEKVRAGEWMGQITHNQEFSTYELAFLLGLTDREAHERAIKLQEARKITMADGGIVIPAVKEES